MADGQHVVYVLHEVDAADDGTALAAALALAVPRQSEDGLAERDVGALAAQVAVQLATRHVPRYELVVLSALADGLCHRGHHLAAFVHAVQPPQVAAAAGGEQVLPLHHQVLLRFPDGVVPAFVVQAQADVVSSRLRDGDGVALRVVADSALRHAPRIARQPVGGDEAIGMGVVASHQAQVVQSGYRRAACCGEPHGETVAGFAVLRGHVVGQRELYVVEAAAIGTLRRSRNLYLGNGLTIDAERGFAAAVVGGEAAEDAQAVGEQLPVVECVLHVAAGLRVAVSLAVVRTGGAAVAVFHLMAGLALLFAGCHEVECPCLQGLVGGFSLRHVAVGEVLGRLLIPVALVAGVVDVVERAQLQRLPSIGGYLGARDVDVEHQIPRLLGRDAAEHVAALADEQGRADEALDAGHVAGCVVHATLVAIHVGQCLVGESRFGGFGFAGCGGLCCQQDGPTVEGHVVAVAGTFVHRDLHGQEHADLVALVPLAVNHHIAGSALHDVLLYRLAVDADLELLACPCGMSHGYLVAAATGHGHVGNRCQRCGYCRRGRIDVGEAGLLPQSEVLVAELAGGEEVHIKNVPSVVGIDEVGILGMVLHARAHAAPHRLVHGGIDAVGLRAQRGEVDVAARQRVLRREDVVPHRVLVEVGIAGVVGAVAQHLAQFQHVVGVAALGAVGHVDVSVGVGLGQEVLAHAVAAYAHRTVLGHVLPEVLGSPQVVRGGGILLADALKADVLRHLRVGVAVVEERGVQRLHAVEHGAVAEALGGGEVFLLAEQLVGIHERLVDAAVLAVEEGLQVAVAHLRNEAHHPVGHLAEHLLGQLAVGV